MLARTSAFLLSLAIAAPLAGFAPRVLGPRTHLPEDRRPSWAHLVVVTCDRLSGDQDLSGPGIEALQRRGARTSVRAASEPDLALAAANLWTGRRVNPSELDSRAGPLLWSMSSSASRTGALGAAFLERPLASAAHLSGFDHLIEQPDLGPAGLLRLAEEHFDREPAERKVLWMHLADPGPDGERLDRLIDGVHRIVEARGQGWDTLLLVTPLCAEPKAEVPLWIELPSDMLAGRWGRGCAESIDVATVLIDLLRLPPPDVSRGELPVESSLDLAILLRGGRLAAPREP